MSDSQQRLKSDRITAWVTPELKVKIQQVVRQRRQQQGDYTTADFVREAIRQQIDQQEEILGSKAYQVRTFKRHVEQLEARLARLEGRLGLFSNVVLQLLSIVWAVQLKAAQQKDVSPQQIIDLALKSAVGEKGLGTLHQVFELATTLTDEAADKK